MSQVSFKNFPLLRKAIDSGLFTKFSEAGFELRFVGGCVRDALLGLESYDVDLATTSTPQETCDLLSAQHIKWIPTGIEYGTITAVIDHTPYQITSLREDWHSDGRHAYVQFGTNWRNDAMRRDFTINALSADPNGEIFDYFEGLKDLKQGHIQFIGSPDARIEEDYLRILRFFRFYSRFGKTPPSDPTLTAIRNHLTGIQKLSLERVTDEILRLFGDPSPLDALNLMAQCGVFETIFKTYYDQSRIEQMIQIERTHHIPADALRRLSLIQDSEKYLRLSNAQKKHLLNLQETYDAIQSLDNPGPSEFYTHGHEMVQQAFLIKMALIKTLHHPNLETIMAPWTRPTFPVTGRDLMKMGIEPGPHVGDLLKACESWWISQNFCPNQKACILWIQAQIDSHQP